MSAASARWLKPAGWVLGVAVVAALVAAISIVGSPAEARRQALDHQRVEDLAQIRQNVRLIYADKHRLPADLAAVRNAHPASGYGWSYDDPSTRKPYGYRRIDARHYELSVDFEADTIKRPDSEWGYDDTSSRLWKHHPGPASVTFDAAATAE